MLPTRMLTAPSTIAAPGELHQQAAAEAGSGEEERDEGGDPGEHARSASRAPGWRSSGPRSRRSTRRRRAAAASPARMSSQVGVSPMSVIAITITAQAKASARARITASARHPPLARSSTEPAEGGGGGGEPAAARVAVALGYRLLPSLIPSWTSGGTHEPRRARHPIAPRAVADRSSDQPPPTVDHDLAVEVGAQHRHARPPPRRREGRRRRVAVGVVGADRDHARARARPRSSRRPSPASSLPWWATLSTSTSPGVRPAPARPRRRR